MRRASLRAKQQLALLTEVIERRRAKSALQFTSVPRNFRPVYTKPVRCKQTPYFSTKLEGAGVLLDCSFLRSSLESYPFQLRSW